MQRFLTTATRTGGPKPAEGDAAQAGHLQAPQMPDLSKMTPEMLARVAQMHTDSEFFLAHLVSTTIHHVPDVARLRGVPSCIVVGVGAESEGQMPHLAALALAERL